MEAVNQRNSGFLGDLGFDVLSNWGRSEDAKILSLVATMLVSFYCCHQQIESILIAAYFSSTVRVAIKIIIN